MNPIDELLATEAIRDLLAHYCERLDEYDIDGVADCFTTDAITDYGPGRGGPIRGRSQIRERIATGQSVFRRTHHQMGQSRIRVAGETAAALSYVTATHRLKDGRIETVWLRYDDQLVLHRDGWRISRRDVHVSDVDGFDGADWRWVPRKTNK